MHYNSDTFRAKGAPGGGGNPFWPGLADYTKEAPLTSATSSEAAIIIGWSGVGGARGRGSRRSGCHTPSAHLGEIEIMDGRDQRCEMDSSEVQDADRSRVQHRVASTLRALRQRGCVLLP